MRANTIYSSPEAAFTSIGIRPGHEWRRQAQALVNKLFTGAIPRVYDTHS